MDVGGSIAASNIDMSALEIRNAAADQIVRAAHVVLRFLFGTLTTQRELGT